MRAFFCHQITKTPNCTKALNHPLVQFSAPVRQLTDGGIFLFIAID